MKPSEAPFWTCLLLALLPFSARSQSTPSYCASDGQPEPIQLLERFINADCDRCWTDPATPKPGAGAVALDWIVPGAQGDDAPLAAAASRDGLARLESLRKPLPARTSSASHRVEPLPGSSLRVAHGLALGDYMAASIELKPIPRASKGQSWTAWLALVETLPAGTEGSPVARNLVRNLFQPNWDGRKQLSKDEQNRFFEQRSMRIAPGVDASRLRVIGWVENPTGQVVAAAESQCVADNEKP
jgi:hypothetical protein